MVLTKYVEDTPRVEDKPKRELTISEWLNEMADEGFTGKFIATNNDGRVYKGDLIERDDGKVVIKSRKIPTQEETRNNILQQLKK
jgi:hypothetical protein